MQKITPFLWFNDNAEEALKFYKSVFGKDAKIGALLRYGKGGPGPEGSVITASMKLFGQSFTLLNGGPKFGFTEAISFMVNCKTQREVDTYWKKLTADGGEESMCGWLKDRFGVSWQIIPEALIKLMQDKNPEKSRRVMMAMLQMRKIVIADLKKAHQGKT